MKKNIHRGSSFDDFLKEEGLLNKCTLKAWENTLLWFKIKAEMNRNISKGKRSKKNVPPNPNQKA